MELASEMVALLGKELKNARKQIKELEAGSCSPMSLALSLWLIGGHAPL